MLRKFCFFCSTLFVGFVLAQADTPAKPQAASPTETGTPPAADEPKPADKKPVDAKSDNPPTADSTAKPDPSTEPKVDSPAASKEKDKEKENEKPEAQKEAKPEAPKKEPEIRRLPHLGSASSPLIPGQPWRIHDLFRPRPPVVAPGITDDQPPADATILFDGNDLSQWCHRGRDNELIVPRWKVEDGYMEISPRSGSLYTLDSFASCQLHIEWAAPAHVQGDSQGRGNSGIKLMEKFEIQVLDSYNNRTYADGQAASLYGQYPPEVNASRKPGEWQSYDIFFEAPIFEDNQLKRPAYATVIHNGVLVHHHRELAGPTGARLPQYSPSSPAAPFMLQDHGNPVRYRNIWIRRVP